MICACWQPGLCSMQFHAISSQYSCFLAHLRGSLWSLSDFGLYGSRLQWNIKHIDTSLNHQKNPRAQPSSPASCNPFTSRHGPGGRLSTSSSSTHDTWRVAGRWTMLGRWVVASTHWKFIWKREVLRKAAAKSFKIMQLGESHWYHRSPVNWVSFRRLQGKKVIARNKSKETPSRRPGGPAR